MCGDCIVRRAAKELLLLLVIIALVRISAAFAILVALWGVSAVFFKMNVGRAFACYATLILLVVLNPFLLPDKNMLFTIAVRGGSFAIGVAVIIVGMGRKGMSRIPLSFLFAYLVVASISSITGWYPEISYMKLIQFSVFLMSIIIGTQNITRFYGDLELLRAFFLAVSAFIIFGSLLLWPFPNLSTLSALDMLGDPEADIADIQARIETEIYYGQSLLCGVLYQSQALAGIASCIFAWLVGDMVFCEKKFDVFRTVLIGTTVPILYLTRSRTGLLGFLVACFISAFMVMPRMDLPAQLKIKVWRMIMCGMFIIALFAVIIEVRNNGVSKWVFKWSSKEDTAITEALTESRMGLLEKSIRDFKLNPMLGMGFQVEERHRYGIKGYSGRGLILTASIEKGVLPAMVIGETGIVGGLVFAVFLCTFYVACLRKKLLIVSMTFATFLATNMGEATFFSPGGPGGIEWMVTVVGGFVLDLCILNRVGNQTVYHQRLWHV